MGLHTQQYISEVNAAKNDSSLEILNMRFGHMSKKGMQILAKENCLYILKGTHFDTCVHYIVSKQHQGFFSINILHRKSYILDLYIMMFVA